MRPWSGPGAVPKRLWNGSAMVMAASAVTPKRSWSDSATPPGWFRNGPGRFLEELYEGGVIWEWLEWPEAVSNLSRSGPALILAWFWNCLDVFLEVSWGFVCVVPKGFWSASKAGLGWFCVGGERVWSGSANVSGWFWNGFGAVLKEYRVTLEWPWNGSGMIPSNSKPIPESSSMALG